MPRTTIDWLVIIHWMVLFLPQTFYLFIPVGDLFPLHCSCWILSWLDRILKQSCNYSGFLPFEWKKNLRFVNQSLGRKNWFPLSGTYFIFANSFHIETGVLMIVQRSLKGGISYGLIILFVLINRIYHQFYDYYIVWNRWGKRSYLPISWSHRQSPPSIFAHSLTISLFLGNLMWKGCQVITLVRSLLGCFFIRPVITRRWSQNRSPSIVPR